MTEPLEDVVMHERLSNLLSFMVQQPFYGLVSLTDERNLISLIPKQRFAAPASGGSTSLYYHPLKLYIDTKIPHYRPQHHVLRHLPFVEVNKQGKAM